MSATTDGGWLDQTGADAWERLDGHTGDELAERCRDIWVAWKGDD
jgi:hypothetical protein